MPWIGRREAEAMRHRSVVRHLDKIERALSVSPQPVLVGPIPYDAIPHKPPRPSPPTLPSVESELRRLASGEVAKWHSPIRETLVSDGLVEVVLDERHLWAGDRITDAGRARLGEGHD